MIRRSGNPAHDVNRPRPDVVVVCAFAADPSIPSEPTIGWAFVRSAVRASQPHGLRVILLTNRRSAAAMSMWAEAQHPRMPLDIVAVGLPRWQRWLERHRINGLARVEYLLWHLRASRALRTLSKRYNVILAHHVTFATEMLPTPIASAGGQTVKIWGPIGSDGVADVYKIQPTISGTKREYGIQILRDNLSRILAPLLARDVDLVVTSQKGMLHDRLRARGVRAVTFPNLILPDDLVQSILSARECAPDPVRRGKPITVMCVGHLIPRKRVELAIAALAEPVLADAQLHVFGSPTGGDFNPYQDLSRQFGVTDRVHFHGSVDRSVVLDYMCKADVLVHPSGREGAVGVIGEATIVGIPVVCFDGTGASLVLQACQGRGVTVDSKNNGGISSLASAICTAASLERGEAADWTTGRFDEFERLLVDYAANRTSVRPQRLESMSLELDTLARLLTSDA